MMTSLPSSKCKTLHNFAGTGLIAIKTVLLIYFRSPIYMGKQGIAFIFVNTQTRALFDSVSGLPVGREDILE